MFQQLRVHVSPASAICIGLLDAPVAGHQGNMLGPHSHAGACDIRPLHARRAMYRARVLAGRKDATLRGQCISTTHSLSSHLIDLVTTLWQMVTKRGPNGHFDFTDYPTPWVVPSASLRHATWQAHQWQPLGGTERLSGPIIRRLCLRIIDLPSVPRNRNVKQVPLAGRLF